MKASSYKSLSNFVSSIEILTELYSPHEIEQSIERLNYIHNYTEDIWVDYVKNIPNNTVKYLLIAEAPPWKEKGRPEYVLDPLSNPRSLISAISRAFYGDLVYKKVGVKETLATLASDGFLVIDSIPFSMDYSNPNKRSRAAYKKLVRNSIEEYMLPKLESNGLSFHQDLRIAFSLKRNGIEIIDSLEGSLNIKDANYPISESNIAVNGAGYPDYKKMDNIFFG